MFYPAGYFRFRSPLFTVLNQLFLPCAIVRYGAQYSRASTGGPSKLMSKYGTEMQADGIWIYQQSRLSEVLSKPR